MTLSTSVFEVLAVKHMAENRHEVNSFDFTWSLELLLPSLVFPPASHVLVFNIDLECSALPSLFQLSMMLEAENLFQ